MVLSSVRDRQTGVVSYTMVVLRISSVQQCILPFSNLEHYAFWLVVINKCYQGCGSLNSMRAGNGKYYHGLIVVRGRWFRGPNFDSYRHYCMICQFHNL